MKEQWYHVFDPNGGWGFAINNDGFIYKSAKIDLSGLSKESARKYFIDHPELKVVKITG